jgi:hypothetical protein
MLPSKLGARERLPLLAVRGPGSGQGPEHINSAYSRWGGHAVPSAGGDSCHRCSTTNGVHPLAPFRLNSLPGLGQDRSAEALMETHEG